MILNKLYIYRLLIIFAYSRLL